MKKFIAITTVLCSVLSLSTIFAEDEDATTPILLPSEDGTTDETTTEEPALQLCCGDCGKDK